MRQACAITPVVLTYNEEPNIRRTLDALRWAERVIVLDSGSTDGTKSISTGFPNVDWYSRAFDSFRGQYEHAIHATNITTDYVLALDADMVITPALVAEMSKNFDPGQFCGGTFRVDYRILGCSLLSSLYPVQLRLFRRDSIRVVQIGHGHKFEVSGATYRFTTRLIHDDRKPLDRWVLSQLAYSAVEADRIGSNLWHGWRDRLRMLGVTPILAGGLAYIRAGGPFKGAAAIRYAYERATYESLLVIRLASTKLQKQRGGCE